MKLALTGIAIVGILVVTVGVETANAQSYRRYGPARTYTPQAYPPQSRGSIPRGVPRTVPFSDPNSPEATGGVILVTITACLMVETDSNRWRRATPRSVPQPHAQARLRQRIFEQYRQRANVAQGPADERCHHHVSQSRVPLVATRCGSFVCHEHSSALSVSRRRS
jgi:hypothetical protein